MTQRIVFLKAPSVGRTDLPDTPGGMNFIVTGEDGAMLTLLRESDQATFTAPAELFEDLTYDPNNFARTMRYCFARLLNRLPESLEGREAFQAVQPHANALRRKLEAAYNVKSNKAGADWVTLESLGAWAAEQIDSGKEVKDITKMTNGKLLKLARSVQERLNSEEANA